MQYDLAIIGGGPAGVAAGVYAARKRLKTILITKEFGGQSVVSADIQNWIGTVSVSGEELANMLEKHIRTYASDVVDIRAGELVEKISKKPASHQEQDDSFVIKTAHGEEKAKTVLVTTGSERRKLSVSRADTFENKGLTYCASCDGPMFSGKDTIVIGGGNAGFETAAQLLAYAKSVTLLESENEFGADPITVEKVLSNPHMKAVNGTRILEIKGDTFVKSVVYEKGGKKEELPAEGVFVEIGLAPTTSFVKDLIELNKYRQIIIDPRTQKTSVKGLWAAGDCTDTLYHQNNIAAGDAVRALEDIYIYLKA
ncbi:MAG: FAD-dependent oxidoreductase [Candidatus Pacebacteria bacterium]|nr:FAD-dependent oxidoreductase [Candidatus Paceibacterota bacterium]